jgi:hypothetical protein
MESGERGASEVAVATYLAYFRVVGHEMDRLLSMCRDIWAKDWLQPHSERVPDELRTLVVHETTATHIHQYEPLLVPGLLQTEGYARAVFRATGRFPDEGIDLRVRVRLERQALLRREFGTDLTFFIPEQVLRSTVGDARVMNDQLLHLALITARPWCTVRVIPASFSLGFLGGPFELLEYANHDPVVYVENQTHSLFLEGPQDIRVYRSCGS